MTLDELVTAARERLLTQAELDTLCLLATQEGKAQDVLLQLMSAGTEAGRRNLAAARSLTAPHASQRHTRKEAIQKKIDDREEVAQMGRTTGLPFTLTHHAFDRYADRHLQGQTPEEVLAFMTAEAMSASPIRERTFSGEQQWVSKSGILFVMRRDGAGAIPVCVTVLPREEDKPQGYQKVEGKPYERGRFR